MRYMVLDLETAAIDGVDDFLEPVTAPANYKDPEKIAAYIAEKAPERRDKAALDLDLARIACIGYDEVGQICLDESREAEALSGLAAALGSVDAIVTFNGLRFDLPLLMRRARYLGVAFPALNLDRYRSPHIDLYDLLTHRGLVSAHGLRWYAKRLGWTDLLSLDPLPNGGPDVGRAIAEGRWSDVAGHCAVDLQITKRLAVWLGVLEAAPAGEEPLF